MLFIRNIHYKTQILSDTFDNFATFRRTQSVLRHSHKQRILFPESAKPRILGMVDTLLQRLREQRDTHIVAIRSAKLSINVLLAHWHHVRTTDTVIVVSSYKTSRFFLPFVHYPLREKDSAVDCVSASYIPRVIRLLDINNPYKLAPVNSHTCFAHMLRKRLCN